MTTHTTSRATTAAAHTTDWMNDGLCRQTGAALFFPEGRGGAIAVQIEDAKKVCNRCPVQEACLQWALETGQRYGVWGGMSEDDRDGMYATAESQAERCWDNEEWINEQVAKGVPQRDIARQMGVTRSVLCRVIKAVQSENTAVAEGVKAA